MPACDARYDATLSEGRLKVGLYVDAVLDFLEERLPDDWGDPGQLVDATLVRYTARPRVEIQFVRCGRDNRKRLLLRQAIAHPYARHRRYLRWKVPDEDPPPHDDPEWILPP